jgi:uncharacterized protein YndB with AHSA1/START domain
MASAKNTHGFSITMSYIIYGSPAKVFDALTQEGIIGQWCDGGGKVEPVVDGEVHLFGDWVKGRVTVFDKKGKMLAYTWKPAEWDKKTPASLVAFKLMPHAAGTEIFLEHTGLPSQTEADKHHTGWIDYFFEPLNDYFTFQQP